MHLPKGQGELFFPDSYLDTAIKSPNDFLLGKNEIENWQKRISLYQEPLFKNTSKLLEQKSLFEVKVSLEEIENIDLLSITPLPLNFWRWPRSSHKGPAIYLVMDKLIKTNSHLLLYIGETVAAEKRWKGDHDCKIYLQSYLERCQKSGLTTNLSIRFWQDVPMGTKKRRQLEQNMIQKWLPAFNKETRAFWNTPFTNQIP